MILIEKLKALNNKDFLENLNKMEEIFKDIKSSIKAILKEEPNVDFKDIVELNNMVEQIKKTSLNMKKSILIKNIQLEPLENTELVTFCKKTGFTRDDLQRVIKISNDINSYNLENDFYVTKELILAEIAEKEKEEAIKTQKIILEKEKQEELQKKIQIEEENNKSLKIDRNIFDGINELNISSESPENVNSNDYGEELVLTNYPDEDEISFTKNR